MEEHNNKTKLFRCLNIKKLLKDFFYFSTVNYVDWTVLCCERML